MEVHENIFHFGIIDRTLGVRAPGFLGRGIIGKDADDIQLVEIGKFVAARIFDAPAEYEM